MLGDFEARLAVVLGSRMPGPFAGRVQVEPGTAGPPRVLVSVRQVELIERDIGEPPDVIVPGADVPRRVMRGRCRVVLRVIPTTQGGRAEEIAGLDAAMYLLDGAEFRDGRALVATGDPGFLIRSLRIDPGLAPVEEAGPGGDSSLALTLH